MIRLNRNAPADMSTVSRSTFSMLYGCSLATAHGRQDYRSLLCRQIENFHSPDDRRRDVHLASECEEAISEIKALSNRVCRVLYWAISLAQNDRTPDLTRDEEIDKWLSYMREQDPTEFSAPVILYDVRSLGLRFYYEQATLDIVDGVA